MDSQTLQTTAQALKGMIAERADKNQSKKFEVLHKLRILEDTQRNSPDFRKEVMPSFPTFDGGSGRDQISSWLPSEVANRLRPYTSLVKRLSALAFKELDMREAQLILNDNLTAKGRAHQKKRIQALTSGMHPVWENWILALDRREYYIIDRQVRDWLNEPIDWGEIDLFKKDWEDTFYSAKAAKQFLEKFPPMVLSFIGIDLEEFTLRSSGSKLLLCTLPDSVTTANERARQLDLNWHFKLFKP